MQPEMSAFEVTDKVLEALNKDIYDTVILNYANGDMVGHTGVISATVKAVETVDTCVGKIVDKVLEKGGVCLVTADHGNAEKMLAEDGSPHTAHTTNLVPLIITDPSIKIRDGGILGDLTPTMLDYLNVEKPKEMTGESLILKK
jgi:2,3-bisphosphoglycerate-independent phosphoglycerate mutase